MAGSRKPTQNDDTPAVEDDPQPSVPRGAESAAPTTGGNEPRPWRVETYSQGDKWGWRLCAANGVVLRDVPPSFDDRASAIESADDEDLPEGTVFMDRQVQPVQRRGW